MVIKYCDPLAYSPPATFVGSTSGSSTTLTVASVSAGRLLPGMLLSGAGITAGTHISTVNTNATTDALVSVTMSAAMTVAASTTITTSSAGSAAHVPIWNTAQDGDGTATTAAVPAIGSLLVNAVATAGNSIVIMGVTLTAVASGAGATQFNVGASTSIQADNLALAINAATGTVNSGTSALVPQLRNMVYARGPSAGAPANTVEIMTRCGSSTMNHATNSSVAMSSAGWSTPPTVTQFIGSVGGCWGYLFNIQATMWKSAIAVGGYGLWANIRPYLGLPDGGDVIYIRANDVTLSKPNAGTSLTITTGAIGTLSAPVYFVLDNGTAWPGDGAGKYLKFLTNSTNGSSAVSWTAQANSFFEVIGSTLAGGSKSLRWEETGSALTGFPGSQPIRIVGMQIVSTFNSTGAGTRLTLGDGTANGCGTIYEDCLIKNKASVPFFIISGSLTNRITLIGCELSNEGATVPNLGLINNGGTGYITFSGCKFTNFVTGSRLTVSGGMSGLGKFVIQNQSWGNVTVRGPAFTSVAGALDTYSRSIVIYGQNGDRDFSIETCAGLVEWNSTRAFPTLNARLLDGITPWSWHVIPSTVAGNIGRTNPLELPRLGKINSLASGARTFRLEFCLEKSVSWTKNDISMVVMYTDVNGNQVSLNTFTITADALSASEALWPLVDDAGVPRVEYQDSGALYHNRYKLEVDTPAGKDLLAGSDVGIYIRIHTIAGATTKGLFIDPEVVIL